MGTEPSSQDGQPEASTSAISRYVARGFEKNDEGFYPKTRDAILVRWSIWALAVFFGMAVAQLVFGVFLR